MDGGKAKGQNVLSIGGGICNLYGDEHGLLASKDPLHWPSLAKVWCGEKEAMRAVSQLRARQIAQVFSTDQEVFVPATGITHLVRFEPQLPMGTADTQILKVEAGKTHVAESSDDPRSFRHRDKWKFYEVIAKLVNSLEDLTRMHAGYERFVEEEYKKVRGTA